MIRHRSSAQLARNCGRLLIFAALIAVSYAILDAIVLADANAQTNTEIGNSCGESEISDPAIVRALNAKIGQFGGPSRRVSAIQKAPPLDQDTAERHTRCHGTLVFADGETEIGLLLQDSINGVTSWRWHSDKELAEGAASPAQKKRAAEVDNDMRRNAENTPNKMVGCGVEGPETVYTTWAVCYAVIKLVRDNQGKFRPYHTEANPL